MMSLLGVLVLLAGLVTRRNPLLVVTTAALVAGLGGGVGPLRLLTAFGKAFNDARYISIAFLILGAGAPAGGRADPRGPPAPRLRGLGGDPAAAARRPGRGLRHGRCRPGGGGVVGHWLPLDDRFAVVAAYGVGMMLFTVVMGNALAFSHGHP